MVPAIKDPLVIDMDGDGVNADILTGSQVYFDMDNDGIAEAVSWVRGDDGFLVRDLNSNGTIDNSGEMFGNNTLNGFEALKALDSNLDGKISAADAAFSSLKIWQDLNKNGVSEANELTTLTAAGITSIDVANYTVPTNTGNGMTHVSSVTKADGTTQQVANINLAIDQRNSAYTQDYNLDLRALFLPTLKGHGNLADLHVALSLDNGVGATTLMSQMQHLMTYDRNAVFANWDTVKNEFKTMLFNWANVDGISPTSRGPYVNGQELAFLEAYLGTPFVNHNFTAMPSNYPESLQGQQIEALFDSLVSRLMASTLCCQTKSNSSQEV